MMPLEVKVIRYKGQPPVNQLDVHLNEDGGTIGRAPNNHLTLPDPDRFISRNHASIRYENGICTLTDTSTDGTFIHNKTTRVHRESVTLADGDHLWIGEYELSVHVLFNESIPSDDAIEAPQDNPSWWPGEDLWKENQRQPARMDEPDDSPLHDAFRPPGIADELDPQGEIPQDFDFSELIGDLDKPAGKSAEPDVFWEKPAGRPDPFQAKPPPLPSDPFETRPDAPPTAPTAAPDKAPARTRPPEASIASDSPDSERIRREARREVLRIFLEAAGVTDESAVPTENIDELMKVVGIVFREMVQGLMTVLRGRTEIKTQLQLPVTIIKPVENNPLKFFPNADEAMQQLLTQKQPGYVDPVNAVREGFTDVMNHQLAITAGIQAAVINLIERFNPEKFDAQNERGALFQKKAKPWERYRQAFTQMAEEALEEFFGKSFARAYEAQIRQLQSGTKE
jgi:type VI secretion system protein